MYQEIWIKSTLKSFPKQKRFCNKEKIQVNYGEKSTKSHIGFFKPKIIQRIYKEGYEIQNSLLG